MGSCNEKDNRAAYRSILYEKTDLDITHGVDVLKWKDESNQVYFTLWDFAGKNFFYFSNYFIQNNKKDTKNIM